MPLISINILTKDRASLLSQALDSIAAQRFMDYEVIAVNDGSADVTAAVLQQYKSRLPLTVITHPTSQGITSSRQEALERSGGEYVALLDDDDRWLDNQKLQKQADWFRQNPHGVLVGGAVSYDSYNGSDKISSRMVTRATADWQIRATMLLRNNFFTSTVMFRRAAAMEAGGFVVDGVDVAEDYDLWLRLGQIGQMANFREVFTAYRAPRYNKDRVGLFYKKQLNLIAKYKANYEWYWPAKAILQFRLALN